MRSWMGRTMVGLSLLATPIGGVDVALAQSVCDATLCFDGGEPGVVPGSDPFSFAGSNWSGGTIARLFDPLIYSSGFFAYVVAAPTGSGMAVVTFDDPVVDVEFTFQHGGRFSNIPEGVAHSFDVDGNLLETIPSVLGQGQLTPHVTFDPLVPIARIEFENGVVDSFFFVAVPEPGPIALLASLGALLPLRRRTRGQT